MQHLLEKMKKWVEKKKIKVRIYFDNFDKQKFYKRAAASPFVLLWVVIALIRMIYSSFPIGWNLGGDIIDWMTKDNNKRRG